MLQAIAVWCMKCIDYDEAFQQSFASTPLNWVAPPTTGKEKKATGKGRRKKGSRKDESKSGAKRKRVESEDEDEDEAALLSPPRGTCSRPMRLT